MTNGFGFLPGINNDNYQWTVYDGGDFHDLTGAAINPTNPNSMWMKPDNATFVHIMAQGAGGGGGSGAKSSAAAIGAGGAGGGSGANFAGIYPAIFLPPVLRFIVGAGGYGGASQITSGQIGSDGANGTPTMIFGYSNTNLLLVVNSGRYGKGGTTSGGSGGAGGVIPTSTSTNTNIFFSTGLCSAGAGAAGGSNAGGAGGVGVIARKCTSGASGGGCSAASALADGGAVPAIGPFPQALGGLNVSGPQRAQNGAASKFPFYISQGGGGGSSQQASDAGPGGSAGGWGSGGGGGGGIGNGGAGNSGRGGLGGAGVIILGVVTG